MDDPETKALKAYCYIMAGDLKQALRNLEDSKLPAQEALGSKAFRELKRLMAENKTYYRTGMVRCPECGFLTCESTCPSLR